MVLSGDGSVEVQENQPQDILRVEVAIPVAAKPIAGLVLRYMQESARN